MWARTGTLVGIVAVALTPVLLAPPSTSAEKAQVDTVEQAGARKTPAASVPQKQRRRMRRHGPESARARQKNTPLHEAAAANDLKGARALIEEGADPDAPGVGLATPLHAAARAGHVPMIVLLLDEGELHAAHARARAAEPVDLGPTYLPAAHVPRGDDFLPLLRTYDPARQVLLLVRAADGEERLFALTADGDTRPAPAVCHARARETRA